MRHQHVLEDAHWGAARWSTPPGPPTIASMTAEHLHLAHHVVDDDTHLQIVVGPLDMSTDPEVRTELRSCLGHGPAHLVLDLRAVSFVGSAGLSLLVDTADAAEAAGICLWTVTSDRVVLRPLDVIDVRSRFEIRPTVDAALEDVRSSRAVRRH